MRSLSGLVTVYFYNQWIICTGDLDLLNLITFQAKSLHLKGSFIKRQVLWNI